MRFIKRLLLTGCFLSCFGCIGSIVFSRAIVVWLKRQLIEPTPLLLDPVKPLNDLEQITNKMLLGERMKLSEEELESIIWELSKADLVAINVALVDASIDITGSTKAENPDGFFNFKISINPRNSQNGTVEVLPKQCMLGKANMYFLCETLSNWALGSSTESLFNELSVQERQVTVSFNPSRLTQLLSVVEHSHLTIQNPE